MSTAGMSECVPQSAPSLMGSRFYLIHGSRSPIESTLKRQRHSDPAHRRTDHGKPITIDRVCADNQLCGKSVWYMFTHLLQETSLSLIMIDCDLLQTATHDVYRDQQIQKNSFMCYCLNNFQCVQSVCVYSVFFCDCVVHPSRCHVSIN